MIDPTQDYVPFIPGDMAPDVMGDSDASYDVHPQELNRWEDDGGIVL